MWEDEFDGVTFANFGGLVGKGEPASIHSAVSKLLQ